MRSGLMCAAIVILSGFPAVAQTESTNELPKPIEQCIRDNAPTVERAIDRLPDAVGFLVEDLCAKPIADEQRRLQTLAQAKYRDALKKQCATSKRDEDLSVACAAADAGSGLTIYAPGANKPAEVLSLASKILLDLRIQRMNATSTQGTH